MAPQRKFRSAEKTKSSKCGERRTGEKGRKSRRVRRKCTIDGCTNRVVQGGVCVAHGARRKICHHPGCDKAVKLAGFCSAHGPARRKCDAEGCTRVAVQGGKCLSHGARRRVCKYPGEGGCNKNAIIGGMCKKHHDLMKDANGLLDSLSTCIPITASNSVESFAESCCSSTTPVMEETRKLVLMDSSETASTIEIDKRASKKILPVCHKRGLSIFDEMQTVDAIINSSVENHEVLGHEQGTKEEPPSLAPVTVSSATISSLPSLAVASTKTPNPQVSFAVGPASDAAMAAENEEYFSPTLAIFEQMVQTSQLVSQRESSELRNKLSTPRLSPRWGPFTPKAVSLPDSAGSSSSVVRKVSSNNIVGEAQHQTNVGTAFSPDEKLASFTIASLARDDLSRTVSHDVEDDAHNMSPKRRRAEYYYPAPETPSLCGPSSDPTAIVSAGSHGEIKHLLPKPRPARQVFDHLFIP